MARCFFKMNFLINMESGCSEMTREKTIGGIITFVLVTFMAWTWHGVDIPFPSSYVETLFVFNTIFAFVSIFLQRLIIVLFETNVFEKTTSTIGYAFKYFAIYSSGMNYYVQVVCNRLPFVLNKLVSSIFFVYMVLSTIAIFALFD